MNNLNNDGLKNSVLIIKNTDTTNIVTNRFDKRLKKIKVEL